MNQAKGKMLLDANDSIDGLHKKVDPAQAAIRGGVYALASKFITIFIQLGSLMVLARLLAPEMFGLIAMVSIFTGLAALLKDAGLSTATVQRKNLTHAQISNLFWCNVLLGVILTVTFASLAPALAWLYDDERIFSIVLFISISYAIHGLSVQQNALLRRQMRYGLLSAVFLIDTAISSGISIAMALMGFSYWALASAFVSSPIIVGIILWAASGWRPCPPKRGVGTMSLIKFGAHMTFSSVMDLIAQRADRMLLGLTSGPEVVGLYSKASNLSMMPKLHIVNPLGASSLASLSEAQDDFERFSTYFRRGTELIGIVGASMSVFIFLAARDIVWVILGEQWLGSVDLVRVLAILAFFESLNLGPGWLLLPLGRGRQFSVLSFFRTVMTLGGVLLGLPYGAQGVAIGCATAAAISYVPRFLYASRNSAIGMRDLLTALWRPIVAGLIGGALLHGLDTLWTISSPLLSLLVRACFYFVAYLGIIYLLPGGSSVFKQLYAKASQSFGRRK